MRTILRNLILVYALNILNSIYKLRLAAVYNIAP